MNNIFISGLINTETTVKIEDFPIEYCPIHFPFFGVNTAVSGVGYNIAKALTVLGDNVTLFSLTGNDDTAALVRQSLQKSGISCDHLEPVLKSTPQSVVLFGNDGRRQIYCDLKDIQDKQCSIQHFKDAASNSDLAVLCNINYNRPLLTLAKEMGKTIATDVHVISDIHDDFNADFMRSADILFLSDENITGDPAKFIKEIASVYDNKIIVTGLGAKGALLYTKESGHVILQPAVKTRDVVNTVGAGDALFSAFVHFYSKTGDPILSIKNAAYFASYKIGDNGAANGFPDEATLLSLTK